MLRSPRSVFGASALLVAVGSVTTTGQLLGPEFQVNTYTLDFQNRPAVAADAAGNFVIAWRSPRQYGLVARRFAASGEPLTEEIVFNPPGPTSPTEFPAVAADAQGNFVVAWQRDTYVYPYGHQPGIIAGRRFDAAGQSLGDEFEISETQYSELPALAAEPTGSFVVVWNHRDSFVGAYRRVLGRRYGSDGQPLGSVFPISSSPGHQLFPDVAMWPDRSFVVTWRDFAAGAVVARRFDPDGEPVGAEFEVDSAWAVSAVAARGAGAFVVVGAWGEFGGAGVAGRSFDADGPTGPAFEITPFSPTYPSSDPDLSVDDTGGFLVVWTTWNLVDPQSGVRARRFAADDAPLGSEFRVNAYSSGSQLHSAVTATQTGRYLVTWDSPQDGDDTGVFARQVSYVLFADGFETGDACEWSGTVGGGCP